MPALLSRHAFQRRSSGGMPRVRRHMHYVYRGAPQISPRPACNTQRLSAPRETRNRGGLRHSLWDEFKHVSVLTVWLSSTEAPRATLSLSTLRYGSNGRFQPDAVRLGRMRCDSGEPIRDTAGHLVKAPTGSPGLLLSRVTKRFPYDGYTDPEASEQRLFHNPFGKGHTYLNSETCCAK